MKRQFTARTGDWFFLGAMIGALVTAIAAREEISFFVVFAVAFLGGWLINEAHRKHDENSQD